MIEELFNVVAPVFICVGLGWGWAKTGRPYDTTLISSLVMAIGAPCLVFSTLSSLTVSFQVVGQFGCAALVVMALSALIGLTVLHLAGVPKRAFLPVILFPNVGNMGLPLCLFAFGKAGLSLAIVVFAVYTIIQFTVGAWLYSGETRALALLKMPIIYAVLISLVVLFTGITPPPWFDKTTELLGDFTIPLMLITLGVSLAQLHVENIRRAISVSLFRLAIGFSVGLLVASLFRLSAPAHGVLILQSTMPAAVFNYLLAAHYNRYANDTAGIVVISTVIAMAALPFLLVFLRV
jgi:predicted permease